MTCSLFLTWSSRFWPSCRAFSDSMDAISACERSCILRRCLSASFARPMPRSASSFSWMSFRIAWASFCFISTSSWAMVFFFASWLARNCSALRFCACFISSSFLSRDSRSSSVLSSRCEAFSCSSWRLACRSARKRLRAASLLTSVICCLSSSWLSSSLSSFALVAASTLPPTATCSFAFGSSSASTSSSSSSSSGVGSCARQSTFWARLSCTKSSRSITQ
mmetsp:Transcript_87140/g.227335  ORF Transcript_87140/g.227335 Transcript_87140/m.227335 type:complete len:222 (-) Transcript_87140:361-1026(-)